MKLLVMVLNKEEYLDQVLSMMAELEISGATIIDSEGMEHALAYDVPIFAGLQKIVGGQKSHNKTIFALLEDAALASQLKKLLKQEGLSFDDEENGTMFLVDADKIN